MNTWYSTIYKACIIASVIAFIIGFLTQSQTSLGAYISGYSVLILGIMMILVILIFNALSSNPDASNLSALYSIMMTTGPFIIIFGVISFVLYLLINYKNNIISGNVAPGYNSFNTIITMLIFIQLYLVYNNINTDKFKTTGKISRVTSGIIYLLGVITAICSIILYTILKYFTTDGFKVNNQV
jgi:hypothetical protein